MKLVIVEGFWINASHNSALLTITKDGGSPYSYGCVKGDSSPTNVLLWEMLQKDNSMVRERFDPDTEET